MNIYEFLDSHGITYERFEHAPVFTCEEADREVPKAAAAVQTKNLFLRDHRGRRHWLVVTSCAKAVDLKALAAAIGADHLSLASAERLAKYLGVSPGAVTVLGLVHDQAHAVALVVDEDVWRADVLRCHPLVNSATLVITHAGLERFLDATGHAPRVLVVPARQEVTGA